MDTSIQRWGNSSAIRIPKPILKTANIAENDAVQITATKDRIVIRKSRPKHITLAERLKGFDGVYTAAEFDVASVGGERFWENGDE
jgi:antitoxin MazE